MIRLNFIEVIVFYEVPQIFIATDIFDTKYLCLLYPHDDELCYRYLAVKISEKRLNLFKGQVIDLLSIYQTPEDGCYFDVVVKRQMILSPHLCRQIRFNLLCYRMMDSIVIMMQLIMKNSYHALYKVVK